MTMSNATAEFAAPVEFSSFAYDPAGVERDADNTDRAPLAVPEQPASRQESAFAITSFVLGVASIVAGWTFIAPIVGLVFGILALRRNTSERGLALWGVWLNVAMLALTVIALIAVVFFVGVAVVASLPLMA